MGNFILRLKKLIEENPRCLNSVITFKGTLQDSFPQEKLKIRLLVEAYEAGAMEILKKAGKPNVTALNNLQDKLINEYGRNEDQAHWALDAFCVITGKKSAPSQGGNSGGKTPPKPPSGNKTPYGGNQGGNRTPSRRLQELRNNFKGIFGYNEVWSVYRKVKNRDFFDMIQVGAPVQPNMAEKQIFLQYLGLRGHDPNDMVHVTAWADRSAGWAFSENGFFLMGEILLKSDEDYLGMDGEFIRGLESDFAGQGLGINIPTNSFGRFPGYQNMQSGSNTIKKILYKDIARAVAVSYSSETAMAIGADDIPMYNLEITHVDGTVYRMVDLSRLTYDMTWNNPYAESNVEISISQKIAEFLELARY